jgi:hypothetical protein
MAPLTDPAVVDSVFVDDPDTVPNCVADKDDADGEEEDVDTFRGSDPTAFALLFD